MVVANLLGLVVSAIAAIAVIGQLLYGVYAKDDTMVLSSAKMLGALLLPSAVPAVQRVLRGGDAAPPQNKELFNA